MFLASHSLITLRLGGIFQKFRPARNGLAEFPTPSAQTYSVRDSNRLCSWLSASGVAG